MASIYDLIKKGKSKVSRRCYIKRRVVTTGLFETDWVEITSYVKKWGNFVTEVDSERFNKFKFSNPKIVVRNDTGYFNAEDDESSIWFGYAARQRTLIQIRAGFIDETYSGGIYTQTNVPKDAPMFDIDLFDDGVVDDDGRVVFTGLLVGDINSTDKGDITLNIAPISQIFRDFPAAKYIGYTSTGLTASTFVQGLRDMTDGAGSFVFRPFFNNTTTGFNFTTTTNNYLALNTTGADDIVDNDVWSVLEKLAEAEGFLVYTDRTGVLHFKDRTISPTTESFHFYGPGFFSSQWGTTIKSVSRFGPQNSKFYSRVQLKFKPEDTSTSYQVYEASLTVAGTNSIWNYGYRTYSMENTWIATATSAQTLAQTVYNNVSAIKRELEISTTFIPHLDVLNIVKASYDAAGSPEAGLGWDLGFWHDTVGGAAVGGNFIWDGTRGDAIKLNGEEFIITATDLNLDTFECKFKLRES
jgi:hypothetical protein